MNKVISDLGLAEISEQPRWRQSSKEEVWKCKTFVLQRSFRAQWVEILWKLVLLRYTEISF